MPSVVQLALSQLLSPETYTEIVSDLIEIATAAGLSTTAWQPLGQIRTMMTTFAQKTSDLTNMAVAIAAGGFLTLAQDGPLDSAGSVTPGMVDLVAYNQFNVQRTFASPGVCQLAITNAGSGTFSFGPQGLHAVNPTKGTTFTSTNAATVAVPAGSGVGSVPPVLVTIQADVPGTSGSSGVGTISQLAIPVAGISVANTTAAVGSGAQPKATLVSSCQAKLASLSPLGAPGAWQYFAQNPQALNGTPLQLNYGAITQALPIYEGNGAVEVVVANATGPVEGAFEVAVSALTGISGQIAVGTTTNTTLITGDTVTISNAVTAGGMVVNGTWTITVLFPDVFVLNGSTFVGSYTSGGTVTGGDLGQVALSLLVNAVAPDTVLTVASATGVTVTPVGTIYVHKATSTPSQILSKISTALTNFYATVPIGGYAIGAGNKLPLNQIIATIAGADPSIVDVVLTSPSSDVSLGSNGVPVAGSISGLGVVSI